MEDTIKTAIDMSLKVIRAFDWLTDLYVLDFFVDDHWNKLPDSWQKAFHNMDPQILGMIISGEHTGHMLPLSFLALIKTVDAIGLPRKRPYSCNSGNIMDLLSNDSCAGNTRLKNVFLKHVKLKKRHEIILMGDIVKQTSLETKCEAVIDFGSGLGHLTRVLAYKYGLYTAGIECQSQLSQEARKLDLELEYAARKHLTEGSRDTLRRPTHLVVTLSSIEQLHQLSLPETMKRYGLVGLHPCGDLGPLLLKHFVKSSNVEFICVVGCCYMKLTCDGGDAGYPMSKYVKELDSALSYVSREISCHALEVYTERLRKGDYEDLKIHAYRAALERLLVEHDPKFKHAPVRSIKHSNAMTFKKYCSLAMEKLNIPPPPPHAQAWDAGEAALRQWRRVVSLYTLRLAIAPLIETLILLDRVLYVIQHGLTCKIYPVFDPTISPRNHIIIAKR